MMRCYGEFLCSKCGRITKEKFEIDTTDDIDQLYIECHCGKHVEQFIPTSMRDIILSLASKGYKMKMIMPATLGIVFNHRVDINDKKYPQLPYEFSYDMTEEEGDIICNQRMQYEDYEGLDKDAYIKEATQNLQDWADNMPFIEHGVYEDRTKEDKNDKE